jgi:uncharacterized protein (DUF952 family)
MTIFHITTQVQWQKALLKGFYLSDSLETEGFIHASTAPQVPKVFNAFYADQADLVLLAIAPEKLESQVKWEVPVHPDGKHTDSITETEKFPHIYGKINLNAVTVMNLNHFLSGQSEEI